MLFQAICQLAESEKFLKLMKIAVLIQGILRRFAVQNKTFINLPRRHSIPQTSEPTHKQTNERTNKRTNSVGNSSYFMKTDFEKKMNDSPVLEKAQNSETQSFQTLVEKYREQALRVAFRYLRNWEEAADCVQESFLKAFEKRLSKLPPQNFSAWFFRILVNCCLDELRSARKRRGVRLEDGNEPNEKGFEDSVNEKLTAEKLLASLPLQLRSLIILHDIEGFSFEELANILGRSESAVRGMLFRARKKLANNFSELQK